MTVTAALLGLLAGLAIGGIGGGGSVLTVPALVYVLGQAPREAMTGSVLVVGIAALVGLVPRVRDVDWRIGLAFGAVGVPAASLGAVLAVHTPQRVLLLAFAGIALAAALAMVADVRRSGGHRPAAERSPGGATRPVLLILLGGAAIGLLTGFLGVGGGFLVVPVLVVLLRLPIRAAIATSLLIIALAAAASLASRLGRVDLDPGILVPFALAALAGTLAGKPLTDRMSGPAVSRLFAGALSAIGIGMAAQLLLVP